MMVPSADPLADRYHRRSHKGWKHAGHGPASSQAPLCRCVSLLPPPLFVCVPQGLTCSPRSAATPSNTPSPSCAPRSTSRVNWGMAPAPPPLLLLLLWVAAAAAVRAGTGSRPSGATSAQHPRVSSLQQGSCAGGARRGGRQKGGRKAATGSTASVSSCDSHQPPGRHSATLWWLAAACCGHMQGRQECWVQIVT
jgi:hypothetical protein